MTKDNCLYFECEQCAFLFHRKEKSPAAGSPLGFYNSEYWQMERAEAMRREWEDSFIRALELIFLSTIKVENILDFGCGLGITVGLLRERLALNAVGIDISADFKETEFLHRCSLEALPGKYHPGYFDAIYSIEVFEHLEDPRKVLAELARLLKPGGKLLINTGTREFIERHDPEKTYIDPIRRGHISIYSLKSFERLASEIGHAAEFMGDRKYAVILAPAGRSDPFPNPANLETIQSLGEWYPVLLREYMRLVFLEKSFEEKSAWAMQLLQEVESLRSSQSVQPSEQARKKPVWQRLWK